MSELWMNEPPPQSRKRTRDSRATYPDLQGWLEELGKIQMRKASSWADHILTRHFEGLPVSYIRRCTCLVTLEEAVKEIKHFRPPRGQREGHFTTSLLMEVNNQIARLKKGE